MINNVNLMNKFTKISLLLRRNNQRRTIEALGDPCRGQSRVLSLLKAHPEISQKDLASMLDIRSQSLGELLMKLERNGYITRDPSDADRRSMRVRLTPEGAEAANRLEKSISGSAKLFDCLNSEEKAKLISHLDRLIDALEKETGNKDKKCSELDLGYHNDLHHSLAGVYESDDHALKKYSSIRKDNK